MFRLAALIFIVLGASLAGTFMVAALVAGLDTATPIIVSALAGFVVALPASWLVAKQLA